jgi:hypothetical protein
MPDVGLDFEDLTRVRGGVAPQIFPVIIIIIIIIHGLYSSPNIFRVIKSRRMRWAGHVARMGKGRGVYRVLVGKPEGKRPLETPRRRWDDNIKMDLREIGIDGMNWIRLAQDRVRWRPFVNTVMKLRVP